MKKIVMLLIVCIMLSGCTTTTTEIDMGRTQTVIENTLKEMAVVDDETLTDVYNLDLSLMNAHTIKQNTGGDLYAIIETDNKQEVKEQMDEYFEKVKQFNTAYSPERLEILENRVEKEIGNYLIYIVAEDADDIYKDILDSID